MSEEKTPQRLLLVDTDAKERTTLADFFAAKGFSVTQASDGSQARKANGNEMTRVAAIASIVVTAAASPRVPEETAAGFRPGAGTGIGKRTAR